MRSRLLAVTALMVGLTTSSAKAIDPELIGSDTLDLIMRYLFDQAPANTASPNPYGVLPGEIVYDPQGSGNGETEIEQRRQEIAPMSRFLDAAACSHVNSDVNYRGCWNMATDVLAVIGNAAQSCSELRYTAANPMPVADTANGVAGLQCPGCNASNEIVFDSWQKVLRTVYSGVSTTANTAPSCNSDERNTLVSNWSNLFEGGCPTGACANGLKHAFRRDNVSGTTAVFIELLGLPTFAAATSFCNGNETQDADPVRRACAGTGANAADDTVCGVSASPTGTGAGQGRGTFNNQGLGSGNLGLVLPVLKPEDPYGAASGAPAATRCSPTAFGGHAEGNVAWPFAVVGRYGARCPNGAPQVFGNCKFPKLPGTGGAGPGFGCIAQNNSRPAGSPSTNFDARVYNLFTLSNTGSIITYNRPAGAQLAFSSFYRYKQHSCRQIDATLSVGCFAANDPCVMGFGGQAAVDTYPTTETIELNGQAGVVAGAPNVAYPMRRPLYVCQTENFPGVVGGEDSFITHQRSVYNDLLDNDPNGDVADAVSFAGYFPPIPHDDIVAGSLYPAADKQIGDITKECCTGRGKYDPATDICTP